MDKPRLHPQSWNELRQLVKLHGLDEIRAALEAIEAEPTEEDKERARLYEKYGPRRPDEIPPMHDAGERE